MTLYTKTLGIVVIYRYLYIYICIYIYIERERVMQDFYHQLYPQRKLEKHSENYPTPRCVGRSFSVSSANLLLFAETRRCPAGSILGDPRGGREGSCLLGEARAEPECLEVGELPISGTQLIWGLSLSGDCTGPYTYNIHII